MSLSVNDLNKVITPCGKYYGEEQTKEAVKNLKDWYKKEAFNDDDLTNDWIPNDFKNCHGIDIFVDKLNHQNSNKKLLFDWLCHWMLHNVDEPSIPLDVTAGGNQSEIEQIGNSIAKQLQISIDEFDAWHEANKIGQCFIDICKEEDYTEINELKSDLENLPDSYIMDEIIRIHPEYDNIKKDIFEVLQLVVFDNYPPFDPKSFKFTFTKSVFEETKKVCKEIRTVFARPADDKKIKDKQDSDDTELMWGKAIDFENRFPVLSSLMDAFGRYCAYGNRIFWSKERPVPSPGDDNKKKQHESVTLNAKDWFKQRAAKKGTFCHHIQEKTDKGYIGMIPGEFIKTAVSVMLNRMLPKFNYDHVLTPTIYDKYDSFAKIVCAMNEWIYEQSMKKDKQYGDWDHIPIQIDLWIIPRLVRSGGHQNMMYDQQEIDSVKFDPDHDDDDSDDGGGEDMEVNKGKIESLGKKVQNRSNNGDDDGLWDLEKNLNHKYRKNDDDDDDKKNNDGDGDWRDGYIKDKDYFMRDDENFDNARIVDIKKWIKELWDKYNDYRGWSQKRYKRYILIIDRRNPQHIKNKQMVDDTEKNDKTWSDRMYLFAPKKCGTISKRYGRVLNECFAANTKDYLFPMPVNLEEEYCNDFGGLESGNGYKFVISYQLYFRNKVKMYWYLGQSAQRFFMDDIKWLWPRYFKTRNDENTFDSFQRLTYDTERELDIILKQHKLEDKDFETFLKTANLYKLIQGQ